MRETVLVLTNVLMTFPNVTWMLMMDLQADDGSSSSDSSTDDGSRRRRGLD